MKRPTACSPAPVASRGSVNGPRSARKVPQAQKVLWVLRAVRELPQVPKQYFKKLEGTADLWEVRAEFGGDAFRLLGFWDAGAAGHPDEWVCQEDAKDAGT